MERTIKFHLCLNFDPIAPGSAGGGELDQDTFTLVANCGGTVICDRTDESGRRTAAIEFCTAIDDAGTLKALEILHERLGWTVSEHSVPQVDRWEDCLFVTRKRHYTETDIEAFELHRWLGPETCPVLAQAQPGTDSGPGIPVVASRDRKFKLKSHLGAFECRRATAPVLVSAEMKAALESKGLTGLQFSLLHREGGVPLCRELWAMTSDITLPLALTRMQNSQGSIVPSPPSGWAVFDDGYSPAEVSFDAEQMASIGKFDAGQMQEYECETERCFVVSRRFREALREIATTHADWRLGPQIYIPVHLV